MLNITIAILFIVVLAIIYKYNTERFGIVTADILTSNDTLDILRKMLKDTHSIFITNNIRYWIDGGTLLGAVRHKGIIPWDDDADLAVLENDKHKFLNLRDIFYEFGYGIANFWGGYKIYPLNGTPIKHYNRNWHWNKTSKILEDREVFNYKFPFIDIFFVNDFNGKYHFSNKYVRSNYNKYYHEKKDLFPLKMYEFDGFELIGPNNPKPYLDRAFGGDYMTIGYKSYDHENMRFLPLTKFKVAGAT